MEGISDELSVETKDKLEIIHHTIQQLIEEKKKKKIDHTKNDQDEDQLLLSRLLSQVELLKEDNTSKLSVPLAETTETPSTTDDKVAKIDETGSGPSGDGSKEMGTEEIVKELKKVKKQNSITHCLLSVMIILTIAWQFSEVSLILRVKDKLSNPFRSIGDLIGGAIKNSSGIKVGEGNNEHEIGVPSLVPHIETPHLPELKIPDLSHMELPALGLNDADED